MTFGAHYEHRPTEAYPVMQRTGIKFFRKVAQTVSGIFAGIGQRGFFIRDIGRAFSEPATWGRETIRQMRNIGVDSVPLVIIVAGFLGAVTQNLIEGELPVGHLLVPYLTLLNRDRVCSSGLWRSRRLRASGGHDIEDSAAFA